MERQLIEGVISEIKPFLIQKQTAAKALESMTAPYMKNNKFVSEINVNAIGQLDEDEQMELETKYPDSYSSDTTADEEEIHVNNFNRRQNNQRGKQRRNN